MVVKWVSVHSSIYHRNIFFEYLYILGTVIVTRDRAISKRDKNPCHQKDCIILIEIDINENK